MNRFFLPVINRTKEMSSQSNQEIKFFNFADQYFRNNRYSYGLHAGKLCLSFYILNPRIEDCGNYYLLSDFTVVHDILTFEDNGRTDIIYMNSYSNYNIRMNKNKSSNDYYNNRYNGFFKAFIVSAHKKYYNGYPYYPTNYNEFVSLSNVKRIYLTKLEYLVDAEKWDRYESRYYHLVNPELTPEKIQEKLREEQRRIQEEQRRLAEQRRQAEQKIPLAQEKINDEVEKEDLENINALYKDIKDGKIKNMPNSMKTILLSYIANVSENVQFHLRKEIKEIYKALNNIKDDLELYIHNI